MNAIFWLAVFGSFVFFSIFFFGLAYMFYAQKNGTLLEQAIIRMQGGPFGCIKWRFLVFGIASLIVAVTL